MDSEEKLVLRGGCLCVMLIPICFIGCYAASSANYSEGFRDGTIQKISERGMAFKTCEGELVLGGMSMNDDGTGNATFNRQIFRFSVSDADVRKKIESLKPGEKIRLHYRQSLTAWGPKGETSYFATSVEALK